MFLEAEDKRAQSFQQNARSDSIRRGVPAAASITTGSASWNFMAVSQEWEVTLQKDSLLFA
jgi:hypothetical protein